MQRALPPAPPEVLARKMRRRVERENRACAQRAHAIPFDVLFNAAYGGSEKPCPLWPLAASRINHADIANCRRIGRDGLRSRKRRRARFSWRSIANLLRLRQP